MTSSSRIQTKISQQDKFNTPNKIINNKWSELHELFKDVEAHLSMSHLYSPLQSPLMTFLSVVKFILSKFFQWYKWCYYRRYQSFSMPLETFSFLLFLSLISPNWILCPIILQFEWVANDTCYLWVINVIYNSLNCVIF